ncbi:hypothetical protein [Geminisphaera colitermitum]|uniref:hypothetical protein n=1 Tax=Geminisphaera colitermitum TaxID=1148786 RepID=UPI0001964DD5|nr:hypothetical protein [Geminisphaera colitermitum]
MRLVRQQRQRPLRTRDGIPPPRSQFIRVLVDEAGRALVDEAGRAFNAGPAHAPMPTTPLTS